MRINIYHTNDIHSNYDFLRKVHLFMQKNKHEEDLYFDIGDFNDLKSILVEYDKGISATDLLVKSRLDAIAIGNNEIDLKYDNLKKIVNKFPFVCANIKDGNNDDIPGLKKSLIFERYNKRFLVLSVAPYYGYRLTPGKYNKFFLHGNLQTTDPIIEIKKELEIRKGQYDFCILLSHSGHIVDEKLIDELNGIDLFLGAHTHIITIDKDKKYSMCGKGEALGRITLEISDDNIEVIDMIHIELNDSTNKEFDKLYSKKLEQASKSLSKEIPTIRDLNFNIYRENELINFLCDCLYKKYECDLAIMHNGIATSSLEKPVSKKTLLETFPSKLHPTVFKVSGDNILKAIKKSFDYEFINGSGEGAGFRGNKLGTLGFSHNVKIIKDKLQVYINDEILNPNKMYAVASDDYLQRGTWYASLRTPDEKSTFERRYIRSFIRDFLNDKELFNSSKLKRIY